MILVNILIASCLLLSGEVTGGILDGLTKQILKESFFNAKYFQLGMDKVDGRAATDFHAAFTGTKVQATALSREYKLKLKTFLLSVKDKNTIEEVLQEQERQLEGAPCGREITCDPSARFRTADGTCNNLQKPELGSSFQPFSRFVPSDYEDGVFEPRVTEDSKTPLPSPRAVSVLLHTRDVNSSTLSTINSHMLMQYGQFLDHDMTLSPFGRGLEGSNLACCQQDLSPEAVAAGLNVDDRPQCFGIDVPSGDARFPQRNCLNFIRSDLVEDAKCRMLPAEQLNVLTAYVDGSQVYGSTEEEQFELRNFVNGGMKIAPGTEPALLPPSEFGDCRTREEPFFCFLAGDERVNEQMGLASMHTIWLREHNRIARTLAKINPLWEDERIFQETRRIVGAMLQKITFNDFLPMILSQQTLARNILLPIDYDQFGSIYKETVDPGIGNAFATAAYRFGHSLVNSVFARRRPDFSRNNGVRLRYSFGNTAILLNDTGKAVDELTRGLALQRVRLVDRHITPELTNFLFLDDNGNSLDLMSLNIQRGRDHGLPGYNAFRSFCGLSTVNTFSQLIDHTPEVQEIFKQLYSSPGEIDLFSAGISETPLPGGLLGPTFACLVADQFRRLKTGDRFFFETADPNTRFTLDQLKSIRNTTLSRVICDNTDTTRLQPQVFQGPIPGNRLALCNDNIQIPRLDLNLWKEKCEFVGK